ncbi:MAG: hypothetical protein LW731_07515 [Oxalobacteraceae bacterium]|nr:hypothetical protein [Oxalobacteraceae bacterium]
MFRTLLFVTSLFAANVATAAASYEQAIIGDNEPVVLAATAGNSWTVIGAVGVQQIDYVVNCVNKSVALAGFQVLKSSDDLPAGPLAVPSYDDLSFYIPKLDIDRNVADTACDKRLAQAETTQTN